MARAYLDHASSSPLRPEALDAMLPYLREHHADPGRADLGDYSFRGFQNPVARRSGHRMCFYHWRFSWDWTVRKSGNCTGWTVC